MKLIVGLGNPGKEYEKSRHNIGQRFIDQLRVQRSEFSDKDVKLHKTNIFMNDSGREVKELATRYSLLATNLLIVHDDLDLPPGKWKLQFNRSAAGHKGVQSVIDELGTQEFWRLRIGIGKPPVGVETNDFVIQEPTREELRLIDQAIAESMPRVLDWAA